MSNDARILERRILAMKKPTLKTNRLIVCLVSVSMVLLSSITAFAYEAPVVLTTDSYNSNHTIAFSPEETPSEVEPLPYGCFFTNSNGTVYNLEDYNSQERILCFHMYEDGYFTDHVALAGGKCSVTYSHAKQCIVCNAIVVGERISLTTYELCPH